MRKFSEIKYVFTIQRHLPIFFSIAWKRKRDGKKERQKTYMRQTEFLNKNKEKCTDCLLKIILQAMHNDVLVKAIQQWDNINRIKFPIRNICTCILYILKRFYIFSFIRANCVFLWYFSRLLLSHSLSCRVPCFQNYTDNERQNA